MRASSKHPRVESSGVAPPPPSSTGDTTVKESIDLATTVVAVPPASTSDDSDIRYMLEIVMTFQATHGQILVDMFDELHALQADLERLR